MTFFADLSFSQPQEPTFRVGLQFECTDARSAVTVVDAYIKGFFYFAGGNPPASRSVNLESLATRKTRGVEYVRI